MEWSDFERLEYQHYEMLFLRSEEGSGGEGYEPEEQTTYWIDWESQEEDCEDRETVIAESEEEAAEIFRQEMIGVNGIPEDAEITAIIEVA